MRAVVPAPRLVILMGLQASGKSSFARARLADSHVVLSKDAWPNARNKQRRLITLLQDHMAAGNAVVVDNTNPAPEDRRPLIEVAVQHSVPVTGYWFESQVDVCRARNELRDGRFRVPDVGLFATAGKLKPPVREEGFDELYFVRLVGSDGFEVDDWIESRDG